MEISTAREKGNISLTKLLCLIFIPTSILTFAYFLVGNLQNAIPSIMLFYVLAAFILFPIELTIVFRASKKEYGKYSLKSAFANYKKMHWGKIFLYGSLLFAFAGLASITVAPLENMLLAPVAKITPEYFNWNNIDYLKQYSPNILLVTCTIYMFGEYCFK